jgi:hypothetical protein
VLSIGKSNAILPMTTVASSGAYLLSTPVEFGPNAAGERRPTCNNTEEAKNSLQGGPSAPVACWASLCTLEYLTPLV